MSWELEENPCKRPSLYDETYCDLREVLHWETRIRALYCTGAHWLGTHLQHL